MPFKGRCIPYKRKSKKLNLDLFFVTKSIKALKSLEKYTIDIIKLNYGLQNQKTILLNHILNKLYLYR